MINILKLTLLIAISNTILNSQDAPFGQLTRIRKLQQNIYGDPLGLVAYKTNVLVLPMRGGDVLEFNGEIFVKSQAVQNVRAQFADSLNGFPFIAYENQITFKTEKPQWNRVSLVEYLNDYQIISDMVYFTGKNPSDNYDYVIRTKDFVVFERLKINFVSDSVPRIFKIKNKLFLSSQNRLKFDLYSVVDFKSFNKVDSKTTNILDAIEFKDKLVFTSGDGTGIYCSEVDFSTPKPAGFQANIYNFLSASDMLFAYSANKIFYSSNASEWQSFYIESNSIDSFSPNQMVIFDNHLLFSGDRFDVYKIGPITSSKPLSVESELIHAIKITGNVGQQVEILASDDLNGEYTPLTYFTLPSTEYIYNDNRTNKVKQYYKVR